MAPEGSNSYSPFKPAAATGARPMKHADLRSSLNCRHWAHRHSMIYPFGLAAWFLLPLASATNAGEPGEDHAKRAKTIQALIDKLNDDDFQIREQAEAQLSRLPEALPTLRANRSAAGAEQRKRIEKLIGELYARP